MRLFEFFQNPQEGNDMLLHECNLTCFPSLSSGKNRVKKWVNRKLLHVCILTCFPSFSSPTRVEQFSCWFELKPIVIILKLIFKPDFILKLKSELILKFHSRSCVTFPFQVAHDSPIFLSSTAAVYSQCPIAMGLIFSNLFDSSCNQSGSFTQRELV